VTGWAIRARRVGWRVSYRAHLALLSVLAVARFVCFGLALLAHRAHTAVAGHGRIVADTLGAHGYAEATRPDNARYERMAFFLLHPKEHR